MVGGLYKQNLFHSTHSLHGTLLTNSGKSFALRSEDLNSCPRPVTPQLFDHKKSL